MLIRHHYHYPAKQPTTATGGLQRQTNPPARHQRHVGSAVGFRACGICACARPLVVCAPLRSLFLPSSLVDASRCRGARLQNCSIQRARHATAGGWPLPRHQTAAARVAAPPLLLGAPPPRCRVRRNILLLLLAGRHTDEWSAERGLGRSKKVGRHHLNPRASPHVCVAEAAVEEPARTAQRAARSIVGENETRAARGERAETAWGQKSAHFCQPPQAQPPPRSTSPLERWWRDKGVGSGAEAVCVFFARSDDDAPRAARCSRCRGTRRLHGRTPAATRRTLHPPWRYDGRCASA